MQDWLRITMGHTKGFDWWYRSRVICAYDCKVLIGHWSNTAQEWHMMSPQPSEKGYWCWNYCPAWESWGNHSPSQNWKLTFRCLSHYNVNIELQFTYQSVHLPLSLPVVTVLPLSSNQLMSTTCLHSYIPIYSNLMLFNNSKYMSHLPILSQD